MERRRTGIIAVAILGIVVLWQTHPIGTLYIGAIRDRAEDFEPQQSVQIEYAADLDTASHKSGLVYPLDIKLKQLTVLEEVGVDTIRITLAHDPFLQGDLDKINDTDQLVSQIKAKGKKLMIADGGAEQYWDDPMDWNDFSQAAIDRVTTVATRYRPDYYIVVKEPVWYTGMTWTEAAGMLTETITVEQWISLTQRLCDAVKVVSPETKTGAAIAMPYPESKSYLIGVDEVVKLDFLGIDVYKLSDLNQLDSYLDGLDKPTWILETWDGIPDRQIGQAWRRESSAEWLQLIANYAQSRNLEGIATFYNLYLCYDYSRRPRSFEEVRNALDERQKSFHMLEEIIRTSR